MSDETSWQLFKSDVANIVGEAPVSRVTETLRRGSKGEAVKVLQTLLNQHGYQLVIDGDFGYITEAAVKGFQRDSVLVADGIVGPKTWAKLYER